MAPVFHLPNIQHHPNYQHWGNCVSWRWVGLVSSPTSIIFASTPIGEALARGWCWVFIPTSSVSHTFWWSGIALLGWLVLIFNVIRFKSLRLEALASVLALVLVCFSVPTSPFRQSPQIGEGWFWGWPGFSPQHSTSVRIPPLNWGSVGFVPCSSFVKESAFSAKSTSYFDARKGLSVL